MPRVLTFALGLLLVSCGGQPADAPVNFAQNVGAWSLAARSQAPASDAGDPMRRFGVRRIEKAAYEGPGKAAIEVYLLSSEAGGLELEQTWRPLPSTVVFHRGDRFVVVRWEGAGRDAVTALVRDLEKRLSAQYPGAR
jgi:hypothetical protein